MSAKSVKLTNNERLVTDETTQAETVGSGEISRTVHAQGVFALPVGNSPEPLAQYLATSAGSIEMNVNGSVTAVEFELAPPDGAIYRVDRLRLVLVTGAALGMSGFGDLAALSNGITAKVLNSDGNEIYDLLDGVPLKSGNDLVAFGYVEIFEPGSDHTLIAESVPSTPFRLHGAGTTSTIPRKLEVTVADDLSTLTQLRMLAIGCNEAVRA